MNTALWILAGLLAAVFAAAGATKLAKPRADLAAQMPWVDHFSDGQVKAIGALELLGAIGLVLPAAVDIAPWLVPVAATGLTLVMLGAVTVHVRRGDPAPAVAAPLVLALASAFLAVGRFAIEAF